MSPRTISFGVICGLSGLVFGMVENAVPTYVLHSLAIGITLSIGLQIACDVQDIC